MFTPMKPTSLAAGYQDNTARLTLHVIDSSVIDEQGKVSLFNVAASFRPRPHATAEEKLASP